MMFDTFFLVVPKLLDIPGVEVRQRVSSFGPDDDRYIYVQNIKLGRVEVAKIAFRDLHAWTGSPDRGEWTVLSLDAEATEAAQNDDTWRDYLNALLIILREHSTWRITCESDCEQYPRVKLNHSPESLAGLLDSYRTRRYYPIAFYSEFGIADPRF